MGENLWQIFIDKVLISRTYWELKNSTPKLSTPPMKK
jgi:hypothetical protein